jgi:hypothetical protein
LMRERAELRHGVRPDARALFEVLSTLRALNDANRGVGS